MPDLKGKLSDLELQQVISWLETHQVPHFKCPFCGTKRLGINPFLVNTPIFLGAPMGFGEVAYVYVQLACEHCGHTILFNAVTMGILKNEEPSTTKPQQAPAKEAAANG